MKLINTLSFFLFFSSLLFSQKNSLGVFAGGNLSSLLFKQQRDQNSERDFILGYHIGGHYSHALNQTIGIRGEIVVQHKGGEFKSTLIENNGLPFGPSTYREAMGLFENPDLTIDHNRDFLTYIEVPILLQIKFGNKINYLFHLGQSFGYRILRHDNYVYGNRQPFSKFNHSLVIGPGMNIPINEKISAQLITRCQYGLNDIGSEQGMSLKHFDIAGAVGLQYTLH